MNLRISLSYIILLSSLSQFHCRYINHFNPDQLDMTKIIIIAGPLCMVIFFVLMTPSTMLLCYACRECYLNRKRRVFVPGNHELVPPAYSELDLTVIKDESPPTYDTAQATNSELYI